MNVYDYETLECGESNRVLTIKMKPQTDGTNIHWDLANLLDRIRSSEDIRVIILTGAEEAFLTARAREHYATAATFDTRIAPGDLWRTFTGIVRIHETMANLEKPVIARVNGAVSGLGISLMLACDLIVAKEAVSIVDSHLGVGEIEGVGAEFSVVPGDGGTALIPLFLPPALAKEALLLARVFTSNELAALGVINYVVVAEELDSRVAELATRLMKRSPYVLGWTKRAANRLISDQLARALDAGVGYEMVSFMQRLYGSAEKP